jgi:hypothetical protein
MKQYLPWIIIGILILLLIGERSCKKAVTPEPQIITHIDTIRGDSVPYQVCVPKPYPVKVESIIYGTIPVDTTAILQQFFCRKIYLDTLKNDTSALVIVSDTVEMNELKSRMLNFQNRRPISIITNTTILPAPEARTKVFAGMTTGRSLNNFALGASVMLISKRDQAYSLTYDVINQDAYFSIFWKISFRKSP